MGVGAAVITRDLDGFGNDPLEEPLKGGMGVATKNMTEAPCQVGHEHLVIAQAMHFMDSCRQACPNRRSVGNLSQVYDIIQHGHDSVMPQWLNSRSQNKHYQLSVPI